jgi:MFS family permease
MEEGIRQKHDPFESIKIPEYRSLLAGRFLFVTGLRMITTVCGWWIYNLTNDPLAIGVLGLSEVIPAISFALYAGHVIDKSEKRKMLLRGVSLYLVCAALLFLLATSLTSNYLSNHWIAICIYVIIFTTGLIRAFIGPIFGVVLASIVPRNLLQNATTWNQGTWLSASVTGHAMGGLMIATLGNAGSFGVVSVLIAAAFIMILKLKPKPAHADIKEKATWESVKEGLRYVFKTKEILGALSLDMFAVLFGGAVAMIPVYARDILKVGPVGFGWLNGAGDIGDIIMVMLLTLYPLRRKQGLRLLYAVFGFGISIIVFALSENYLLSFTALLIGGMLDGISVVVRGTIMQLKTPDNMRGRVLSVNGMFVNSSNELGQFESGLAAKLMGVVPSVVFGGCMTIAIVVVTWIKAPSLRKMEY